MTKWLRKTRPLTSDIRSADRYDSTWQDQPVPLWLKPGAKLQETPSADGPEIMTPCNTEFAADAQGLTAYGGMALMIGFTEKLGLTEVLTRHLHLPKRKSRYSPVTLAECTIDAICCGIHRIENTNLLRNDPLLTRARGLSQFPDHATEQRFITKFEAEHVRQLHQAGNALFQVANRPDARRGTMGATLDFDATAAVVYGKQEDAAFGHYNSRDGHRELQIGTCFLGGSKDLLNHQLQRGSNSTAKGFVGFLDGSIALLPQGMFPALTRADGGYFSLENVKALEDRKLKYLMGCPCYKSLLAKAYALNKWQRISADEEVCEVEYTWGDKVTRRVLIARHADPKKTKAKDNGQLPLPFALDDPARYTHFGCITNIKGKSTNHLWQSYVGRSNMENAIKESKLGFGLECLPSKKLIANQAYMALVFLAYNLVNWFKRTAVATAASGKEMGKRQAKGLRQWVLCVPAIVEREADHFNVRLPEGHPSLGLFKDVQAFLRKGMPAYSAA